MRARLAACCGRERTAVRPAPTSVAARQLSPVGEGPPDASQDTEADGEEHDLSEAEIEQVTVRDEGPAEDVEEEGEIGRAHV